MCFTVFLGTIFCIKRLEPIIIDSIVAKIDRARKCMFQKVVEAAIQDDNFCESDQQAKYNLRPANTNSGVVFKSATARRPAISFHPFAPY
jgi:hypothetical protein